MNPRKSETVGPNAGIAVNTAATDRKSHVFDQPDSFGWLSIALHWLSAAIVIAMWVIGQNISVQPDSSPDFFRELHVILGLGAWVLLAGRIAWRLRVAHPHSAGISDRTHRFARAFHYGMLAFLSLLIVSGPVAAWADAASTVATSAQTVHRYAGNALFVLVLLHVLGALKHVMFHQDDSLVRMLWPKR